jgi:acyl carrier protein
MTSFNKLKVVFAETLGIPLETDFSSLQYRSIPQWDSVAHMRLVGAIEKSFDVMLSTDEVLGLSSFNKAEEILIAHDIKPVE